MARIRSIKPSFFRHEKLQDIEIANPGKYIMLVFAGLWTLCDSQGVFEYKPRSIRLDILPFLEFNLSETLQILVDEGFIKVYKSGDNTYGYIPTFLDHQRLSGKEVNEGVKYPNPITSNTDHTGEATGKQSGSNREAPGIPGRERSTGKDNRKGKDTQQVASPKFSPPTLNDVKKYFSEKGYTEQLAVTAFEYYETADWVDSHGNKVRNWKQKMIANWFKPGNKNPATSKRGIVY